VSAVAALPLHRRLTDTRAAIDALNTGTRAWQAFAPSVAAVDAAIAQADAVARSLRELRPAIKAEFSSPQPPKAA
jgi:hypothetical protein